MMVSLSESSFRLSRCGLVRTGESLAGHEVVLEEAISWNLLFDDFDDVNKFLISKSLLTGQNPEQV